MANSSGRQEVDNSKKKALTKWTLSLLNDFGLLYKIDD